MKWKNEAYILTIGIILFCIAWGVLYGKLVDDLDLTGKIIAYAILIAVTLTVCAIALICDRQHKQGLHE